MKKGLDSRRLMVMNSVLMEVVMITRDCKLFFFVQGPFLEQSVGSKNVITIIWASG